MFSFFKFVYFLVHAGFLWLWAVGAALPPAARASHCGGFSSQSRALGTQPVVAVTHGRHAEPSHTRDGARVPCVGRWVTTHRKVLKDVLHLTPFSCGTREPVSWMTPRICFTMNTSVSSYVHFEIPGRHKPVLVPIWI